jgi:hypothetical protein
MIVHSLDYFHSNTQTIEIQYMGSLVNDVDKNTVRLVVQSPAI